MAATDSSRPTADGDLARMRSALAQDPALMREFVAEAREHVATIENGALALERNPADADAMNGVFRAFHTMKGLAAFLGLSAMQQVAHEVESVLHLARNGDVAITPGCVDAILAAADYLRQSVAAVDSASDGAPPEIENGPVLARIGDIAMGGAAPEPRPAEPDSAPARGLFSVRVDTAKLDYLMEMVGEMAIAQALVHHSPGLAPDSTTLAALAQLARITGEVQRTTMALRMVSLGQLFSRLARVARDLSRAAAKEVQFETSGDDTELDKTIAEQLADPLMHMVRNAIDHGIEPPAARRAAGKPAAGRVRIAAAQEKGQVLIALSDDGQGLNCARIFDTARRSGLVAAGAALSEAEIQRLIFEPGFSTAAKVTNISGRGVGLDVVRKHVQRLRGRIEIQSKPGHSTTFLLRLPLTMAIADGLIVGVGAERYIVPVSSVVSIFRPGAGTFAAMHGGGEVALVRGRVLPVVRLCRRFGVRPRSEDPCDGLLVVAESNGRHFCLFVDDVLGKQEVVIKSLGDLLKNVPGIAGSAILGDGRVALILDLDGLCERSSRD